MPWHKEKQQCYCAKCEAALPTRNILGQTQRTKHLLRYGCPVQFGQHPDNELKPVQEVPPAQQLDEQKDEEEEAPVPLAFPSEDGVDAVAFAKDLVLLVVNHGVPWKSAEMIVKLVNSHVHGKIVGEKLPATMYQLRKLTHCSPGNAKLLHTCPVCDFVFVGEATVCDPCGLPPSKRVKRQLIVYDIAVTIREMFGVPSLAEAFEYAFHRVPGDGDVWDGDVLRAVPLGTKHIYKSTNTIYSIV